ncbi:hypothetical protein O7628_11585 [Micromonospora sp. WMMD956]|uniref:hypothetical protein n=1 Tax=Micromonospora sp. WMMD956 TaxID=3016108 RepID=UPI002417D0B4|nr:hypothetical protein [Micromonospora sp. WMMD956]MDG4816142.1 hypothetical protein [Micromonospora sp. WMMD956]
MTGPFLSLAQIRNRLVLTARAVLRDHRAGPDGRCRVCRVLECRVATAARNVIDAASATCRPAEGRAAEQTRAHDATPRPAGTASATEPPLRAADEW